jgi:hypothetical protein
MSSGERYLSSQSGAAPHDRPMTRIEAQIESIKSIASRVRRIADDNTMHAHQLGFFAPSSNEKTNGAISPIPVTTSLDDVIRDLGIAVEELDRSMSLFN